MSSPQTLSEADRRIVAVWAADCAERVLGLFEAQAPGDSRPREAIARTRAFARGELGVAGEIRRRFVGGAAAREVSDPAAAAAARAAGQAASIPHMGAHALGAAAYAAKAVGLAAPDRPEAVSEEIDWQLGRMSAAVRVALRQLPPVGENSSGPLGPGLLASGRLGTIIRDLQAGLVQRLLEQGADRGGDGRAVSHLLFADESAVAPQSHTSGLRTQNGAQMSKLRLSITMSLDGYVAGPDQSEENPLGIGGMELHEWLFPLAAFQEMHGGEGGEVNASSTVVDERRENIGATIMGRNMFGPVRGPWPDESWRGWWGENPPYHHPVFVLTHHAREPLEMEGGNTFHFVTDGIESALTQAKDAARGRDVWLAGGGSVVNQYLAAGLVDEIDVSIAPLILGAGARLFEGLDRGTLKLKQVRAVDAPGVTHIKYELG